MVRRSQRLQEQGYYGPDGRPVVNYRENLRAVFQRRKVHSIQSIPSTFSGAMPSGPFGWRLFLFVVFVCLALAPTCDSFSLRFTAPSHTVDPETVQDVLVLRSQRKITEQKKILPLVDSLWNFALEGLGGHVILSKTGKSAPQRQQYRGRGFQGRYKGPGSVLRGQGAPLVPGECWQMQGSSGQLSIALATHIHISHITIGHITAEQSPSGDIPSAPKHFSVYGLNQDYGEEVLLGTFVYEKNGDSFQTFEVREHRDAAFKYVKLQVDSNHGNKIHTCLYAVRVHGDIPIDPNILKY